MSRPDFLTRCARKELMDTEALTQEQFSAYLTSLEAVNTWSLAYRPTLRWLANVLEPLTPGTPLHILDMGSGQGDMLRRIWAWAKPRGLNLSLTGIDINPWATETARALAPKDAPLHFETGDVLEQTLSAKVDIVLCSLFAHHLSDSEILAFLLWMDEHAALGWFINDLHRHPIPYYVALHTMPWLGINPMVSHDGPLSILRAFTRADWQRLLTKAGLAPPHTSISWFFPFRYVVARRKIHGLPLPEAPQTHLATRSLR